MKIPKNVLFLNSLYGMYHPTCIKEQTKSTERRTKLKYDVTTYTAQQILSFLDQLVQDHLLPEFNVILHNESHAWFYEVRFKDISAPRFYTIMDSTRYDNDCKDN